MTDYLAIANRVMARYDAEQAVDTFQNEINAAVRTLNDAKVRVICHHVIIPAENDSLEVRQALDVIGMTFPRVRYYDGPEGGDE